jgi:3-keto-disaccharide hydrolase
MMIGRGKLYLAVVLGVLLAGWGCSKSPSPKVSTSSSASESASQYLGRWDLTVKTPTGAYPSWIEVSESQGRTKALVVGFGGSATPAAEAQVENGTIKITMPSHPEDYEGAGQFIGKLVNGELVGTAVGPQGAAWQWTGRRAPALEPQAAPKWGKPIRLFNGKNLDGWKLRHPGKPNVWKVEHGILIKDGSSSGIITTSEFKNFKIHLQFKCGPMSNSGVYLRGRYEVQIETDSADQPPQNHTGAVYGFLTPNPEQPRRSGVWQSLEITFVGRTVTIVQNGVTVVNHKEIPGITGGAINSDEGAPGPIELQGSEKGVVSFRDIVLTPAE